MTGGERPMRQSCENRGLLSQSGVGENLCTPGGTWMDYDACYLVTYKKFQSLYNLSSPRTTSLVWISKIIHDPVRGSNLLNITITKGATIFRPQISHTNLVVSCYFTLVLHDVSVFMLWSNCFISAFSSKFLISSALLLSADALSSYFNENSNNCECCNFLSPKPSHLSVPVTVNPEFLFLPPYVCSGYLSPLPSQEFFSCRITFPSCQNIPKILFLLDHSITQIISHPFTSQPSLAHVPLQLQFCSCNNILSSQS